VQYGGNIKDIYTPNTYVDYAFDKMLEFTNIKHGYIDIDDRMDVFSYLVFS